MSSQKIIDIYDTDYAHVIKVQGGNSKELTKANTEKARKRIPERSRESMKWAGETYNTNAQVFGTTDKGENWEQTVTLHRSMK